MSQNLRFFIGVGGSRKISETLNPGVKGQESDLFNTAFKITHISHIKTKKSQNSKLFVSHAF